MLLSSCEEMLGPVEGERQGELRWSFSPDRSLIRDALTRAEGAEIPDTNDFLLKVTSSSGKVIYDGRYGDSPLSLKLDPGNYSVSVKSSEFRLPAFSAPQFGDEQVAVVKKGESCHVVFNCAQTNSGIRLRMAPSFLTDYPYASLFVKSEEGKLLYSYSEKRVAYFLPGKVSVMKSEGGKDEILFSRELQAREILTVSISTSSPSPAGGNSFRMEVDTSRTWTEESWHLGGNGGGGSSDDEAYGVGEVAAHAGEEDVWIYGYIVGGDLSSSGNKMNTVAPFSSDTHLAIASRTSVTDKASCVSVELKKGALRDALGLKANPGLIGRQVFLKGNLVSSYYGIPGIRSVSEWELR